MTQQTIQESTQQDNQQFAWQTEARPTIDPTSNQANNSTSKPTLYPTYIDSVPTNQLRVVVELAFEPFRFRDDLASNSRRVSVRLASNEHQSHVEFGLSNIQQGIR